MKSIDKVRIRTCLMFAYEIFSRLGSSPSARSLTQQTPVPESFTGDKDKGKRPVEDASPSGTMLPRGSDTLRGEATAPSSSRAPAGESSRKESTEVPKDPLEDFSVPPVGACFGEGSFTPSGSFPWISDLGMRRTSSGYPMSRSKLATLRVCGCSRG